MDKTFRDAVATAMAKVLFPKGTPQPLGRLIEVIERDYFSVTWDFEDCSSFNITVSYYPACIHHAAFFMVEVDPQGLGAAKEMELQRQAERAIQVFA